MNIYTENTFNIKYDNINDSINSFHYFDNNYIKEDSWDIELEKLNCTSAFNFQFNKIFNNTTTKKNSIDLSEIEDQIAFVDRLNISDIKPLQNDSKKKQ